MTEGDDHLICCDGHRHAKPVFHEFTSGVKQRWQKRTILDVFSNEFDSNHAEYFERAIRIGAITVEGKRVSPSFVLTNERRLVHRVHKHEPPVTSESPASVEVVVDEGPTRASLAGLRAVYKPGGIPVHSCGPYQRLCLLGLLGRMEGKPASSYRTVHRLDRLTSGVVLLAEDKGAAAMVSQQLRDGLVRKRYLAVVDGQFPSFPSPAAADTAVGGQAGSGSGSATGLEVEASPEVDQTATGACAWLAGFSPSQVATHWRELMGINGPGPGSGDVSQAADAAGSAAAAATHSGSKRPPPADDDEAGAEEDDGMDPSSLKAAWTTTGHLRVSVPCTTVDSKNAIHGALQDGTSQEQAEALGARDSVTLFKALASRTVDGQTRTLVEALPLSGRTHQIRVHLAWLGFPIADDVVYHPRAAARVAQGLPVTPSDGHAALPRGTAPCPLAGLDLAWGMKDKRAREGQANGASTVQAQDSGSGSTGTGPAHDDAIRGLCPNCRLGPHAFFTPMQLCATSGISLASVQYSGPGWRVRGPDPPWALPFLQTAGAGAGTSSSSSSSSTSALPASEKGEKPSSGGSGEHVGTDVATTS